MKKILLLLALFTATCAFAGNPDPVQKKQVQQAKSGYWAAKVNGQQYWYYVGQDGIVWRTTNGRTWEQASAELGKDELGNPVRLTPDAVEVGPDRSKLWNPNEKREWNPATGLGYTVDMNPIIWTQLQFTTNK
ncbi:MAG TPA: hypothetical protein VFV37_08765 [Luteibaculaceae bacterium]|nr:hypothetical protein [Luteibaculaceae bacterium]